MLDFCEMQVIQEQVHHEDILSPSPGSFFGCNDFSQAQS